MVRQAKLCCVRVSGLVTLLIISTLIIARIALDNDVAHDAAILTMATDNAAGRIHEQNEQIRERYLHLIEMALTGSLHDEIGSCGGGKGGCDLSQVKPFDPKLRDEGRDWPPLGHTMIGHKRMRNIKMVLQAVIKDNIQGSFAELGVWRGGACIYAKAIFDMYDQKNRTVHVFDAFSKLPGYGASSDFLMNSEVTVKHNFEKYGVMDESVIFHVGLFKDTVPAFSRNITSKMAVLRIDGNFYDSYQDALYYLYESVPVGGFVIFDDVMSHRMVMACWQDFKREQGLPENLTQIDVHSAYFRKERDIHIDFKFFRPPQDANK